MSKAKTIAEYELDYQGARAKAEEIGRAIHRKHPEISYQVYVKTDEGAYLVLYGRDEERIRRIAEARSQRQVDWILEGTPVYIIYGGPKKPQ